MGRSMNAEEEQGVDTASVLVLMVVYRVLFEFVVSSLWFRIRCVGVHCMIISEIDGPQMIVSKITDIRCNIIGIDKIMTRTQERMERTTNAPCTNASPLSTPSPQQALEQQR